MTVEQLGTAVVVVSVVLVALAGVDLWLMRSIDRALSLPEVPRRRWAR